MACYRIAGLRIGYCGAGGDWTAAAAAVVAEIAVDDAVAP